MSGKSGAVNAISVDFLTRKKYFFFGNLGGLEVNFGKNQKLIWNDQTASFNIS